MANGQAGQKRQAEAQTPTLDQLEAAKKWLQLVAQARADQTLKQRLMDTPVVVLQEQGIKVRPGLDIRVVEDTDKVVYLKLPPLSNQLTDADLDKVVGGAAELTIGTGYVTPTPLYDAFGPTLTALAHGIIDTISSVVPK